MPQTLASPWAPDRTQVLGEPGPERRRIDAHDPPKPPDQDTSHGKGHMALAAIQVSRGKFVTSIGEAGIPMLTAFTHRDMKPDLSPWPRDG